ncbi:hypothetical protein HDU92_000578 [Lobulomyces angularis]|nr:hypothetical protein HDU92_000578 [Lobulomyces angularis]
MYINSIYLTLIATLTVNALALHNSNFVNLNKRQQLSTEDSIPFSTATESSQQIIQSNVENENSSIKSEALEIQSTKPSTDPTPESQSSEQSTLEPTVPFNSQVIQTSDSSDTKTSDPVLIPEPTIRTTVNSQPTTDVELPPIIVISVVPSKSETLPPSNTDVVTDEPPVTVVDPKPPVTVVDPKPPVTVVDPKPPVTVADPKPPVTVVDPKPPVTVADPKPPVTVVDPKPPVTVVDPKPPVTVVDPQPPVTVVDPKPPVTVADPKPPVVTSDPKPSNGDGNSGPIVVPSSAAASGASALPVASSVPAPVGSSKASNQNQPALPANSASSATSSSTSAPVVAAVANNFNAGVFNNLNASPNDNTPANANSLNQVETLPDGSIKSNPNAPVSGNGGDGVSGLGITPGDNGSSGSTAHQQIGKNSSPIGTIAGGASAGLIAICAAVGLTMRAKSKKNNKNKEINARHEEDVDNSMMMFKTGEKLDMEAFGTYSLKTTTERDLPATPKDVIMPSLNRIGNSKSVENDFGLRPISVGTFDMQFNHDIEFSQQQIQNAQQLESKSPSPPPALLNQQTWQEKSLTYNEVGLGSSDDGFKKSNINNPTDSVQFDHIRKAHMSVYSVDSQFSVPESMDLSQNGTITPTRLDEYRFSETGSNFNPADAYNRESVYTDYRESTNGVNAITDAYADNNYRDSVASSIVVGGLLNALNTSEDVRAQHSSDEFAEGSESVYVDAELEIHSAAEDNVNRISALTEDSEFNWNNDNSSIRYSTGSEYSEY